MAAILITGASSGIGAALAATYAAPGTILVLWARNAERLAETAECCRARGAVVEEACFDMTDFDRLISELEAADTRHLIEIAILNAGLGGSIPPGRPAQEVHAAQAMASVNFTAPIMAANLLADRMAERGHGNIVLVGSVAGMFPLPMAPTYSGTKAGLTTFAEALRLRLKQFGVGVSLISPGFIDTPMSRGLTEPKPFLVTADAAAAAIAKSVARGTRHIVIPWQFAVLCNVLKLVPGGLIRTVLRRLMRVTPG